MKPLQNIALCMICSKVVLIQIGSLANGLIFWGGILGIAMCNTFSSMVGKKEEKKTASLYQTLPFNWYQPSVSSSDADMQNFANGAIAICVNLLTVQNFFNKNTTKQSG